MPISRSPLHSKARRRASASSRVEFQPKLILTVPVRPSPQRNLELPAAVSGSVQAAQVEKARAGSGNIQFAGKLTVKPDADACVYVSCGSAVYEAFCMEDDGFAVNVPEGTTPESVIYNVGGVPQMFQIN